ncbi:MAG TPA: lycopene cyclase domain-containing protein [Candidatus Limnocylindria bacterium]|nr:lycopene cyclase domain-containing protein [Candidatus Limnocylindria bacterium]
MTYTAAAALGAGFAVLLDLAVLRTNLLCRKAFWASYLIILAFELAVDGILTGRRLVVYSPASIVGGMTPRLIGDWHVAYAPFEDLLFGFSLVLQTLAWWTWWGGRLARRRALSASEVAMTTAASDNSRGSRG